MLWISTRLERDRLRSELTDACDKRDEANRQRDSGDLIITQAEQRAEKAELDITECRKAISESDMLRSLAYSERDEARRLLEIAPHGERCASNEKPHRCDFPIDQSCRYAIAGCDTHRPGWRNCNCWKSKITPTETQS